MPLTTATHPTPAALTVLALIDDWARECPELTALEHGETRLSYAELARRVEDLAGAILAAGIARGQLVGVLLGRSPELVVAILAVLRAGAAYVPLDPAYPDARLAATLADCGAPLVLTEAAYAARVAGGPAATMVIDAPPPAGLWAGPLPEPRGDDLAYCIYTSGSTGTPKGVLIEHGALRAFVASAGRLYAVAPGDRVLQFASPSFDISVEEIFVTLAHGATLVVRSAAMGDSYAAFARACGELRLTVLDLPTAFWHGLAQGLGADAAAEIAATVRLVIIGGEAAAPAALTRWRNLVGPAVRLVNTYGPTETTVSATAWEPGAHLALDPAAASLPIGAPLAHLRALVLDADLRPVAPGAVGELYLGGASLARGYLGRPELTAERFVSLPGGRYYRTGDLARQGADGALVWAGRADQQVKVRGYRVEPGEIEAALLLHPAVAQAAVVAPEIAGRGRQLRAFVVPRAGAAPAPEELRAFLAERLPDYMLPAHLATLGALPTTVTGKVDRAALVAAPAPIGDAGPPGEADAIFAAALARPVEGAGLAGEVAAIFAVALAQPVGGAEADFFALGGDSLAAMEVLVAVEERWGLELTFRDLYEHPRVAAFAEHLAALLARAGAGDATPAEPAAPAEDEQAGYSISESWLMVRLVNAISGYTLLPEVVAVVLRLRGRLDPALLQAAADAVIARHEALRTVHLAPHGLLAWRPIWPLVRWIAARRRAVAFFNGLVMRAIARAAQGEAEAADEGSSWLLRLLARGRRATLPAMPILLPQTDLAHLSPEEQAAALPELMRHEWWAGSQTFEGLVPIRLRLFRLAPEEHLLTVALDHRVTDGESEPIFVSELAAHYAALQRGAAPEVPVLTRQFADYQAWQARVMQPRIAADLPQWAELYGAIEPRTVLPLPFYRDAPVARDYIMRQAVRDEALDGATLAGLRRLSEAGRATLYMTLLAALAAVVHRHSGAEHVPINISMSNRHMPEYRHVIGCMAQLGQVVGDCAGNPRFSELLARVRRWTMFVLERQEQFAYEVIPLLRRRLGLPDEVFSPLEPRVGVFFDLRGRHQLAQPAAGLTIEPIQITDPFAPTDLYILAIEEADHLRVTINYSYDRYERAGADRLFDDYMRALACLGAGEDPDLATLTGGADGR